MMRRVMNACSLQRLDCSQVARADGVVGQQQGASHNGDASRGLHIAANATFHDKETNLVDNYQSIMLVYKGPFDARPKDDIGIGVARLHVNDDVKKNSELLNAANGVSDYDNPLYTPIRDARRGWRRGN